MANIHEMGDQVSKGFQSHDHAFVDRLCEDMQSWSKDRRHTQAQIDKSMEALTQDLHRRNILTDLQIVGVDGKNHELIARDSHNRTVLVDDTGNRSDSAKEIADKEAAALRAAASTKDTSAQSSALKSFTEGQHMMERQLTQLPFAEAQQFQNQVNEHFNKAFGYAPAVMIPDGQNYRHMTGRAMR